MTMFKATISFEDYDTYDIESYFTTFEKAKEWANAKYTSYNPDNVHSIYIETIELDSNNCLEVYDVLADKVLKF